MTWPRILASEAETSGFLRIEDGNHGEYRPRPHEFASEGVAYIRAADIAGGRIDFARAGKINAIARRRVRKGIGRPRDVLLSHKGTVGRVSIAPDVSPDYVCSPQTTFWRALDPDRLDYRYLKHFLCSPDFVGQLDSRKSESDMAPYVSLTEQRRLVLTVPPICEQRAIAEVLGALDDKLFANTDLGSTADALVRTIFANVASEAQGKITLGRLVTLVKELIEPTLLPVDTAYVGLEHIPRRFMWLDSCGTAVSVTSTKSRFEAGDILFGKLRPYFHKVVSAPMGGVCSTDVLVVRPVDEKMVGFVLAAIASDEVVQRCTAASEGTRMPRTSWKDLAAVEVPWPGDAAAFVLSEKISGLADAVESRLRENEMLAATRDALLPQLMSGKIRVKDAEKTAEEVL